MISATPSSSVMVNTVGTTTSSNPVALHSLLGQLSFTTEVPVSLPPRSPETPDDRPMVFWNGLLCFCLDDDDQQPFFDAEQFDEEPSVTRNKSSSTAIGKDDDATSATTTTTTTSADVALQLSRGGDSYFGGSPEHPARYPAAQHQSAPTPPPPPPRQGSDTRQHHHQQYPPQQYQHQQAPQPPPPPPRQEDPFAPLPPPLPPRDLPDRFLRAGKGDPVEGRRRYEATLAWRRELGMDTILTEAHPSFALIKKHYPHYYHFKGRRGEPVFFEQPPRTNLRALREAGITLEQLLRHYAMITEFGWQCVDRSDDARSITVLDLEGMKIRDFVGDCVEYVRKCSAFTGQHYPERAGHVFVVNVPGWFSMIWRVVQPMVDEVTLQKITILRGRDEVYRALVDKIPPEHIPPEYGGTSVPLGQSPEEHHLRALMEHNLRRAHGDYSCGGRKADCPFCSFQMARSY